MADERPVFTLWVNGRQQPVSVPDTTPLMYVLRNDLGCTGVRTGCSIGECGACRVIVDGVSLQSCITPVSEVDGSQITTPEGLGGPENPHPVQRAFLDEQAGQCGYCVNGMIMSVAARLEQGPVPDTGTLCAVLDEHLCRCGTHVRMLRAAHRAAGFEVRDLDGDLGGADVAGHDGTSSAATSTQAGQGAEAAGGCPTPRAVVDEPRIARWIGLHPSGEVAIYPGKVELGQGLRTAFAQIVASQLAIPRERVRVEPTMTGRSPDQGQTSGSFSIEHGGISLAMAAVALRRVLLRRAAASLGCAADRIELDTGTAVDRSSGERISLGELVADRPITETIEDTDVPRWDAPPLGEPLPREDLRAKLTGAPGYVHDLTMDGMLHARVVLPPSYDATLDELDLASGWQVPGVRQIVPDGRFAVVVAEREEQAIRAQNRLALDARWKRTTTIGERDTERMLRDLPARERVWHQDQDVTDVLETLPGYAASYSKPYQAHGPMAPSAAVAVHDGGVLRVWTHSQGVYPLRRELAALLGHAEGRIVVEHVDGPGCYGMNGADDAAVFAALAARAVPGSPVRFQFSLADEFAWEPHGPGMVADMHAGLGADGTLRAWRYRVITDSHSTRPNGDGDRLMAAWLGARAAERPWVGLGEPGLRNAVPLYDIPALDVAAAEVRGSLRTGPLRSLGAFFNVFAIESFVDELAELAGVDPVEFRLRHLRDGRATRVVEVAAERAGWQPRVGPSGRGLGMAFARYKDTKGYAAEVAEVEVDAESGEFRVVRLVVVCDAGAIVNPDGVRNQLQGGALQGLSRTLYEQLRLTEDGVQEQDWTGYRSLRFPDVPRVDVTLVDRPEHPPLGVGEVATPPVPAAVANAVDDAIGIRLRALPLTADGLRKRLEDMDETEMARVLV
ncbi:xanthine dehydrogenase family protein molybdopterin-binding subunit [Actinobacteria bacterium YIM 96077]|uniref:Xanthine dehydrogenase family protein molybdopterin-binding subunit n=1 Tax=Phytoactinopolyspora halophila TaxID=1981511 RepID=A0A329QN82_9ACTN|nr:molybdopterin cofactor-binding domain-containing protein [Phytoactinopolyspora halophila]AYY12283.1 xanthine dehydrogenase family protein molybdopterin-binding subunit [Actinobacteria bacterium YIM 96077]RAW13800.1 xanthine dehydrogenase family protein molybdopterin-binding subunit [Phytoactinopolyspora halophila]